MTTENGDGSSPKRRVKRKRSTATSSSPKALSVEELIQKATACVDEIPPRIDCAVDFFERALKVDPNSVAALDAYGALLCEEGDHPRAVELLQRSANLQPDDGFDKYCYLAQMSSGTDALTYYKRGAEVLSRRTGKDSVDRERKPTTEQTKLAEVHASIAEIYMTELCDESDAEEHCEAALKQGLEADPGCLELLVALTTLRKVQGRIDDSKEVSLKCLKLVKEATTSCDPNTVLPSAEVCVALCRALIDLQLHDEARSVLVELIEQDEEDIQVWYLLACSHLVEGDAAAVKECAKRGLDLCEQAHGDADDFKQPLQDVLAQASQLRATGEEADGVEAEDADEAAED
jgi:tetratricopeptide (TPR) repeat protein